MSVIRVSKRARYTVVDRRTVNDPRLSWGARGLLVWLLDKPDDFSIDRDELAKETEAGSHVVRGLLKELTDAGYLVRQRSQHPETGRICTETVLYEVPPDREDEAEPVPLADSPPVGKPASRKTRQSENPPVGVTSTDAPPLVDSPPGGKSASKQPSTGKDLTHNPFAEPSASAKGPSTLIDIPRNRTPRVRDPLWDALATAVGCQPATKSERGAWNAAVKQLREVGATAGDVEARSAEYRRRWPGASLSPAALAKHWSALGSAGPAPGPAVPPSWGTIAKVAAEMSG